MSPDKSNHPRIGIPWRTSEEEAANNRPRIAAYEEAVTLAGGEPVLLSLRAGMALPGQLESLHGFVLPGSPADVEPKEYGRENQGKSQPADVFREATDRAILEHAFAKKKPVLAICYGCQLLNVYLGGTLIQDVRSETETKVAHRKKDLAPEPKDDPRHGVKFVAGSRLAELSSGIEAVVNSSHHQAIERPGQSLRVTGSAADGIVESVEWTGDANWVTGVQWHPERMKGDALAERLFSELITKSRTSHHAEAAKSRA
jgi:putative glutamine amidotransferase